MIEALHKTEAKGVAALALYWLSDQADAEAQVRASTTQIVAATKTTKRNALAALQALVELGEIEVVEQGRGRKPHLYRVLNRITAGLGQARAQTIRAKPAPRQKLEEARVSVLKSHRKPTTSGIRSAFRSTISGVDDLLTWCRSAQEGAISIYHVGQIGYDRTRNADLNAVVETVQLFAETGYLLPSQQVMPLPGGRQIVYTVSRTSGGYAPRNVLAGRITARDFGALRIIQHRAADLSATRALRDGLGISEAAAANVLRSLTGRKMLERGHGGGWVLTDQARQLVL
ncbi:hypothetical protein [Salipiger marinus]|uniref:Helix-turn-helix domain-containing protein n=1 Tax=Salipiger marinus TaxID=555512 RepID=A0A1G8MQQ1_9RHOB|nr:hypothetical protein [Salipiger marinus]SDI70252.1 hypothetical protein SAMN04487993_1008209 [Salipiger marinus]